jgi:hypothetical protein
MCTFQGFAFVGWRGGETGVKWREGMCVFVFVFWCYMVVIWVVLHGCSSITVTVC